MPEDGLKPKDRRSLFHRGFGDGAKGSYPKHPDYLDYMAGYRKGGVVCTRETNLWCEAQGIPAGSPSDILRASEAPGDLPLTAVVPFGRTDVVG